jgi:hypothetical protein
MSCRNEDANCVIYSTKSFPQINQTILTHLTFSMTFWTDPEASLKDGQAEFIFDFGLRIIGEGHKPYGKGNMA